MADKEQIKKIIQAIQSLPTLPTVAVKVQSLIKSPTTGAAELAKVIEYDQSISAKLLSLVNSAYYGLSRKINNIREAVAYLGTNTVSQLVLALGVIKTFEGEGNKGFNRAQFWVHDIAVATLSREIAKSEKRHKQPDDIFTAGLLHDIGKVALDHYCTDIFKPVLDAVDKEELPFYKIEQKVIGLDHTRVGEWVARSWELPLLTVVTIRHHHEKPSARNGFSLSQDNAVDIVSIADWLAIKNEIGFSGSPIVEDPEDEIFQRAGITKEKSQEIVRRVKPEILKATRSMGIV